MRRVLSRETDPRENPFAIADSGGALRRDTWSSVPRGRVDGSGVRPEDAKSVRRAAHARCCALDRATARRRKTRKLSP